MDELKKFVSRWSRLKRASDLRNDRHDPGEPSPAAMPDSNEVPAKEGCAARALDLTALPSLESITGATDISPFLQSAVPVELTRAALRRAWVSDPLIRDFIGIAENQWDFTNPATIPGFGPLPQTADRLDRPAQAVGAFDSPFGRLSAAPASDQGLAVSSSAPSDAQSDTVQEPVREAQSALPIPAVDKEISVSVPITGRSEETATLDASQEKVSIGRTHGGALPR